MADRPTHVHEAVTEYLKLLTFVSLLLIAVTLTEGLVASVLYCLQSQSFEVITHRQLSPGWVIALLWTPFCLQLLIHLFLTRKVWQHKRDEAVQHYFRFYFRRTFICSFVYVTLWLCYTLVLKAQAGEDWVYLFRWLSLACIALLIYFVVHATYLITRLPFRRDRLTFTEDDIRGKFDCICAKLRDVSPAAAGPAAAAGAAEDKVRRIHKWLLKDRDYKVHRVAYKGTLTDLDTPHLLEALNRLVRNPQFYYDCHHAAERDSLSRSKIESYNRTYIEENLFRACSPNADGAPAGEARNRGEEALREFASIVRGWVQTRLGVLGRSDRRRWQRDGISMFPFYTMVFFFSVFLCIAYMFAFAFAFEDKYVQMGNAARVEQPIGLTTPGALFMSDDLLEDASVAALLEDAVVAAAAGAAATPMPGYKLNDYQKIFYFTPGGAGITTEADGGRDQRLQHIARINMSSLNTLAEEVKRLLMENGRALRIELVGRADDNSVAKNTYASNYEIAAARINSVRYLLQQKLIMEHVPARHLAALEWVESPFSNDETLPPKLKQSREESKIALVLHNETESPGGAGPRAPKEFADNLDNQIWNSSDKGWRKELADFLERLKRVSGGPASMETILDIRGKITRWNEHKLKEETADAEKLGDEIDAQLYQIEDPAGRKRSVEVYLYDTPVPPAEPTSETSQKPGFKRMALMDYLYFAIYTITTTGYGDIKPMTPYAKFLCTVANMTEVFFIVVFFNTLLSLKRDEGVLT